MMRSFRPVVIAGLAVALSGCGIIERLTGIAARKEARQAQIKAEAQALQQQVMRFGDQYIERVTRRTAVLAAASGERSQLDMYSWQYTQATAVVQIAAGPSPAANALDMVVLVSLNRRIVEDQGVERYGAAADPLLRDYHDLESEAWRLLDSLLDDGQRRELEAALAEWHAAHPDIDSAAFVRFTDFAGASAQAEVRVSPGLLGIIGLDPLAGIDPAVREFEQTRMLAERALYYAQRLPVLLDMQLKLTTARLNASPEAQQILSTVRDVGALSATVEQLTAEVPDLVARERQAAIAQILAGLEVENERMRALTSDLKKALDAGTVTAQALDQLVRSADALVGRFGPDPDAPAPSEPSRPFDINDYTRTITELAATARELQRLVEDVDAKSPAVAARIEQLTAAGRGLVDYALLRALLVILVVLLAAIVYRVASVRVGRDHRGSTSS